MAQCFKCGATLEGDFGVINCGCGEINFLDEEPTAPPPVPIPSKTKVTLKADQYPPKEPEKLEAPFKSSVASPMSSQEVHEKKIPLGASEAIHEIESFGNQEMTSAEKGSLVYQLKISGIDTLELRKAVVESLRDPKFRWSVEELEPQIKDGVLTLEGITPIKVSVLVKRIRHLDLDIEWSQGSIYEA